MPLSALEELGARPGNDAWKSAWTAALEDDLDEQVDQHADCLRNHCRGVALSSWTRHAHIEQVR
jgi:hypothetical protein